MNNILVIGAGRSATALINYVLQQSAKYGWSVTVADADIELATQKVKDHPNGQVALLDATRPDDRRALISRADVVVSLLPVHLHIEVANDCIQLRRHLVTASYLSPEMNKLGDPVKERDLVFMNEMGLDPGIDHMSAMQKIDEIAKTGGKLTAFRSYTGGLIAPASDDNPWHYKFTWNPRNVVLAGRDTAQFFENGKYKYIPYQRLFSSYRLVDIPGYGEYEVYPNRDSLLYRDRYNIHAIPDILRGTIRHRGFCDAWNALVKIGLTDASFPIMDSDRLTYYELLEAFVINSDATGGSLKEKIASMINEKPDSEVMNKLEWLELFSRKKINLQKASPALILEDLLLEKWALKPEDKDMVIMQHEFEYELDGRKKLVTSTLVMEGQDATDTAMSRLVGLPLGIFVKLFMLGKISGRGVSIPTMKEVYEPVLKELEEYGVVFSETEKDL